MLVLLLDDSTGWKSAAADIWRLFLYEMLAVFLQSVICQKQLFASTCPKSLKSTENTPVILKAHIIFTSGSVTITIYHDS